MGCKICLIIIGTITLTTARPAKDESPVLVANENELQQLLKTLYNDGKFDVAFSHHEDGPNSHHEDKARISRHEDHAHEQHYHHDDARHAHLHNPHNGHHKHIDIEEHPSLTNIQNLNLVYKKKPKVPSDNSYDSDIESLLGLKNNKAEMNVNSNVDQVLNLLKQLDNNVGAVNKFGRSNDNQDDDDLDNGDQRDDCRGDRCDRNDDYNNDRICIGDRCGYEGDRYNADDNDRVACVGDRCGRDRYDGDDKADDNDKTTLREHVPDGNSQDDQQFLSKAQKYKISDELDAIVIDMSDLQKSLGNAEAHDHSDKEQGKIKLIENVEFSNLLDDENDDDNDDEESVRSQNVLDIDSKPIEAIVVDLSKAQNDLTNQIKGLMRNMRVKPLKSKRIQSILPSSLPLRGDSKILTHNEDNNNVYVPKWLLEEVIKKTNLREQNLKTILPLTARQKEKLVKAIAFKSNNASKRIFRRSIEDDVGVPFHLQIQGLSQVNPE